MIAETDLAAFQAALRMARGPSAKQGLGVLIKKAAAEVKALTVKLKRCQRTGEDISPLDL